MPQLPAIALDGAKGVGKTATALRRARTSHRLDEARRRELLAADPTRLVVGERPILIDEWQRLPESWDVVRRAVDDGAAPGSFLLTGSANPAAGGTHSGAGRIVRLRMRPLAISERALEQPTISLSEILRGDRTPLNGRTGIGLVDYAQEICRSGFPRIRNLEPRAARAQLDGYLFSIIDRDFPEMGHELRNPAGLMHPATPEQVTRGLATVVFADVLPVFGAIRADRQGNLWVKEYDVRDGRARPGRPSVRTNDVPGRWSVFDREGSWLCDVTLPANFTPLDIGFDYVAGVARDGDGVEYVHLYRLVKP